MLLFFLLKSVIICLGQEIGWIPNFSIRILSVGRCTGEWSSWKDRDDPTSTGDWEMLNLFTDDDICINPVAAEARIIGTTSLTTTETVSFSFDGLKCLNVDQPQPSLSCSDYEIRFCCGGTSNLAVGDCTGQWSPWKDRDNPSGSGDWEMLNLFTDDDICIKPVAAEARIIGTTSLSTTEIVSFSLAGLKCLNVDQTSGYCSDYEIRFCCEVMAVGECTGQWSTWKDRDNPSVGTGDWELLRYFTDDDLCLDPVAAEARIIGTSSMSTTEIVSFSLAGLKCLNVDQPSLSCSDFEVRFCCEGTTNLAVGDCTGQWSPWKDRDDPSGTGDWEMLNLFTDDDICINPMAVESRIIGTSSLSTTEIVSFSLAGLMCLNVDQTSGYCSDYEIRFCCEVMAVGECTGRWSTWKDRDNPSGTGDWELLRDFTDDDLCLDPVAAEARIIGATSLTTTEIVSFSLAGLICVNGDQPSGSCSDYEIRFCCTEITNLAVGDCTGQWSSWKDRDDPSLFGDYELLNLFTNDDVCKNPMAAEARIIGSAVLTTTEVVTFSLDGLRCINSAQLFGVCSDYEVRFCCDERNGDFIIRK